MIIKKIQEGRAHEISEADTMYLGACTKARDSSVLRQQPFSTTLAKPRAFALKQSYVDRILTDYVYGVGQNPYVIREIRGDDNQKLDTENREHVIKSIEEFENNGFEGYLKKKIAPFLGQSRSALLSKFSLSGNAKNINNLLFGRMLGLFGSIADSDEFLKAGIIPKTIQVDSRGVIRESMSFPLSLFNPFSMIQQSWEESALFEYFETKKFLFVILQENEDDAVFREILLWNMPPQDLEELERVWEETRRVLIEGVEIWQEGRYTRNNLPSKKFSHVAHVRPHAANKLDTMILPGGKVLTKQCFWLNNDYIRSQINMMDEDLQ